MLRLKNKKWGFAGCNALISIICAIIILSSPFESITILIGYIGDKDTKAETDADTNKDAIVPVDSIISSEENNIVE